MKYILFPCIDKYAFIHIYIWKAGMNLIILPSQNVVAQGESC